MARRVELQELLEKLLGSRNVYFQPPATMKMKYDCIRYERSKIKPAFADNNPYQTHSCYRLMAIYTDPDSDLPDRIAALPMCSQERTYTADNLYHAVFNLYF